MTTRSSATPSSSFSALPASVQTLATGMPASRPSGFRARCADLDLSMPGLDGYGVIRGWSSRSREPAARCHRPDWARRRLGGAGHSLGAIGFLTKPARASSSSPSSIARWRPWALDQKLSAVSESRKHWECSVACQRRATPRCEPHRGGDRVTGLIAPRHTADPHGGRRGDRNAVVHRPGSRVADQRTGRFLGFSRPAPFGRPRLGTVTVG